MNDHTQIHENAPMDLGLVANGLTVQREEDDKVLEGRDDSNPSDNANLDSSNDDDDDDDDMGFLNNINPELFENETEAEGFKKEITGVQNRLDRMGVKPAEGKIAQRQKAEKLEKAAEMLKSRMQEAAEKRYSGWGISGQLQGISEKHPDLKDVKVVYANWYKKNKKDIEAQILHSKDKGKLDKAYKKQGGVKTPVDLDAMRESGDYHPSVEEQKEFNEKFFKYWLDLKKGKTKEKDDFSGIEEHLEDASLFWHIAKLFMGDVKQIPPKKKTKFVKMAIGDTHKSLNKLEKPLDSEVKKARANDVEVKDKWTLINERPELTHMMLDLESYKTRYEKSSKFMDD